jgi:hypothetical protein
MGWRVALQRDLPAVAGVAVDGKALIFRQRDLDAVAEMLALPALSSFVGSNPAAVAEYLRQQGLQPDDYPIPEEEWFAAADGLRTVRGLLEYLRTNPDAVFDSHHIVRDLTAIEEILTAAERGQVDFYLVSQMPSLDAPIGDG